MSSPVAAMAARAGWRVVRGDPRGRAASAVLFARGSRARAVGEAFEGSVDGTPLRLFEWSVELDGSRRRWLVAVVAAPDAHGAFVVEPRQRYGHGDAAPAGERTFGAAFTVGGDAAAARAVLTDDVRAALVADQEHPYLEVRGDQVIVASFARAPDAWPPFARRAVRWAKTLSSTPAR